MSTYDWLSDIPESLQSSDLVEVQFKNTRKGYYINSEKIDLYKGDIVAVGSAIGNPNREDGRAGHEEPSLPPR